MPRRRLAPALLAAIFGIGTALPAMAQEATLLALNQVAAAPADARNVWRLTLEFGRADRSATASARSVRAPRLAAHDVMITTGDGAAAPFIIRDVSAPSGNALSVTVEYFGSEPLQTAGRFTVRILDPERVAAEAATAEFDFLPPSLPPADE